MKYQIREGKEWDVDVCMWAKTDPPWKGGKSGLDVVFQDGKMINEFAKKTFWKEGIDEKNIYHHEDGTSYIYGPANVCFVCPTEDLELRNENV